MTSTITDLPDELVLEIIRRLDFSSRRSFSGTCKNFQRIVTKYERSIATIPRADFGDGSDSEYSLPTDESLDLDDFEVRSFGSNYEDSDEYDIDNKPWI